MIKQTAITLIIVATGGVHSAAIGYGQDIVISGNNWIQTTCADGATPTVRMDGDSVFVRCHEE